MFFLNKKKFVILSFLTIVCLFNFTIVNAVDDSVRNGLDISGSHAGFNTSKEGDISLADAIGKIIGVFLSFLGVIFFMLVVYGGFIWMTAGGNQDKVGQAKKIIGNAALGIIIVLSAYIITHLVTTEFSNIID
ncbi:MAG: hypothetical protein U9O55_02935 [Patescibacteria group bacterium]|nr:hypothetical protein [Patescibacteria group bacterium]